MLVGATPPLPPNTAVDSMRDEEAFSSLTALRSAATALANVSFSFSKGSNTVTSSDSGAVSLAASANAACE